MKDEDKTGNNISQSPTDSLKAWMMVILTLIFVTLYVAALWGLIEPLKDISIISRLEPIIFVIIGYYFGRLPAQANENALKTEIDRQSRRASAAQQIKENAQQERDVLEEKIRNAKIILTPHTADPVFEKNREFLAENSGNVNQMIKTAVKILES